MENGKKITKRVVLMLLLFTSGFLIFSGCEEEPLPRIEHEDMTITLDCSNCMGDTCVFIMDSPGSATIHFSDNITSMTVELWGAGGGGQGGEGGTGWPTPLPGLGGYGGEAGDYKHYNYSGSSIPSSATLTVGAGGNGGSGGSKGSSGECGNDGENTSFLDKIAYGGNGPCNCFTSSPKSENCYVECGKTGVYGYCDEAGGKGAKGEGSLDYYKKGCTPHFRQTYGYGGDGGDGGRTYKGLCGICGARKGHDGSDGDDGAIKITYTCKKPN